MKALPVIGFAEDEVQVSNRQTAEWKWNQFLIHKIYEKAFLFVIIDFIV